MWHLIGSKESDKDSIPLNIDSSWSGYSDGKAVIGEGPRVLRIACAADTHSRVKGLNIPEADVFIFAGDTIHHKSGEPEFLSFCDWIKRVPCKYKFLVAGNHDFFIRDNRKRVESLLEGVTILEDNSTTIGDTGVTIYGSPWTVGRSLFYVADAYEAPEDKVREKWEQIPTGVDILVTHTPPYEILDLTYKNKHIGSKYLRNEISKRIRPKIHIFGHNHDESGMKLAVFDDGTKSLLVNCSIMYTRRPLVVEYHY